MVLPLSGAAAIEFAPAAAAGGLWFAETITSLGGERIPSTRLIPTYPSLDPEELFPKKFPNRGQSAR